MIVFLLFVDGLNKFSDQPTHEDRSLDPFSLAILIDRVQIVLIDPEGRERSARDSRSRVGSFPWLESFGLDCVLAPDMSTIAFSSHDFLEVCF